MAKKIVICCDGVANQIGRNLTSVFKKDRSSFAGWYLPLAEPRVIPEGGDGASVGAGENAARGGL